MLRFADRMFYQVRAESEIVQNVENARRRRREGLVELDVVRLLLSNVEHRRARLAVHVRLPGCLHGKGEMCE